MRFSQRIGVNPVKLQLQIESMDNGLKNRLWNVFLENYIPKVTDFRYNGESDLQCLTKMIWTEFYGNRIDHMPSYHDGKAYPEGVIEYITKWYFNEADWATVYDFIEFLAKFDKPLNLDFAQHCNAALKKEVSGYRLLDDLIVQVTSEEEVLSIEEAIQISGIFKPVNEHLTTALKLLSDRQNPDYRNSIKESISAVESICKIIVKDEKASFATALAVIEKQYQLHGSLKQAYIKIYGYTSDADGIRHPLLDDGATLLFEDAKFMLVSCSAFINYLKAKLKL